MEDIAAGVARLPILFVNAYMVGERGGPWVLVDTGLPGFTAHIRAAAEERFGPDALPRAIVLTHGHFDHVGSAPALFPDVPVYVHPLELSYVTGKAQYPPADAGAGGVMSAMAYLPNMPPFDLGERARALPEDGSVPGMEGWRWIHTPGHAPGHVAFFRPGDGVLLAGDAFATVDMDSLVTIAAQYQELARPPAPMTPNWEDARRSIEELAVLNPRAIGCGHGPPLTTGDAAEQLRHFAQNVPLPGGWYVKHPARVAEDGRMVSPPPPKPSVPAPLVGALAGAALIGGVLALCRRP